LELKYVRLFDSAITTYKIYHAVAQQN